MFCPNCSYEYNAGVLICPDCGATLVMKLPPQAAPIEKVDEIEPNFVIAFKTTDIAFLAIAKSILDEQGIIYYVRNVGHIFEPNNPKSIYVDMPVLEQVQELLRDLE